MANKNDPANSDIVAILDDLKIPFAGITIESQNKQYHITPFPQISASGVGPVLYRNSQDKKIYTLLQRRIKDNFQWWFPGGYVEFPSHNGFFQENFQKIKDAIFGEHKKIATEHGWQKAYQTINGAEKIAEIFRKNQIDWPQEFDFNWQSAWQREVLEETGVDLDKFEDKLVFDFAITKTFMIGSEPDRLVNIDGKFCAFLGDLTEEPKITPDDETEELKWVALEEINRQNNNYSAHSKAINHYVASLIEEGLFKIICHKIQEISQIENPITKQKISRFNTPQNLQSFFITNPQIEQTQEIKEFLAWEFGELGIGGGLCGKDGDRVYGLSLKIVNLVKFFNN